MIVDTEGRFGAGCTFEAAGIVVDSNPFSVKLEILREIVVEGIDSDVDLTLLEGTTTLDYINECLRHVIERRLRDDPLVQDKDNERMEAFDGFGDANE